MSLGFVLATAVEITLGFFLIWGFWHEEKVVELEDKLLARLGFKRRRRTAKITQFTKNSDGHTQGCI